MNMNKCFTKEYMLWYGLVLNFVWIAKIRKCKTPSTTIVDDEQKMIIQYSLFMLIIQMIVTRIHHYHIIWLRVFYVWCSCSRSPFNFHIEFFFTWILILCQSHSLFGKQRRLVCLAFRCECACMCMCGRVFFFAISLLLLWSSLINDKAYNIIMHRHVHITIGSEQCRDLYSIWHYTKWATNNNNKKPTSTKTNIRLIHRRQNAFYSIFMWRNQYGKWNFPSAWQCSITQRDTRTHIRKRTNING